MLIASWKSISELMVSFIILSKDELLNTFEKMYDGFLYLLPVFYENVSIQKKIKTCLILTRGVTETKSYIVEYDFSRCLWWTGWKFFIDISISH